MLELLQDDVQVFPALGIRVELVVVDHYLALKKEPVKPASRILIFFATSPTSALISDEMCYASHSHRWCG